MARSKRQTRLAFNPLPTSSPTTSAANKELGGRSYANVGYEGSPRQNKRRRIAGEDAADLGLPTPAKSSQFPASARTTRISQIQTDGSSDPAPASSTNRTRRSKTRAQGRLDFSNHIGVRLEESEEEAKEDSGDSSDSDDSIMARTKTPARKARAGNGIFPTQSTQRKRSMDHDESSEDELQSSSRDTPKGKSPLKRLRSGRKEKPETRRTRRSAREDSGDVQEGEEIAPSARQRRQRRRLSIIEISEGEEETSGDDAPELHSTPVKTRKAKVPAKKSYKEDDFVVLDDDEDDFVVEEEPRRTSKSNGHAKSRRRTGPVPDEESEEDDEEAPRQRRRLKRRPHKDTAQDEEDLQDDLEWLQSSPPGAKINHAPKKVNPKLELLEALKRKRAGLEAPSSSLPHANSTNRHQPFAIDSSEEEDGAEVDEEDEYEVAAEARRRGALDEEDDGDDFVIEDEDDPIGAPNDSDVELPMLLNGITRMKPKELFRYAVEWMVQRKLNPAFSQNKETYDSALQRLDDEVRGLAGSKYTSSAWTRDFTISLQARPDIELTELHGLMSDMGLDKCQACNRSGHPATFEIRFYGRPYSPKTLEPIEQDGDDDSSNEDDEDDEEAEREEYDSKSRLVPPPTRTYSVGRFCKDNAMTAHALEHWKYQLSGWIVEWLENNEHLTHEKIVRRDRWDEPRRRKYARKVVGEMEEVGEVRELWRQFREEVDGARERKSGWQRGYEREY